jgi:hypothetical protein
VVNIFWPWLMNIETFFVVGAKEMINMIFTFTSGAFSPYVLDR